MGLSNALKFNCGKDSILKEINIAFGHDEIYSNQMIDMVPNGEREIRLSFNDNQFPPCDLPDLLIMLAEEIRFQLEKQ